MYINDLPLAADNLTCILFADDTTIFTKSSATPNVSVLGEVKNWFAANRLYLNDSKSQNVSFSTHRWHIKSEPTKLLGVVLDSRLDWQSHIEQLCSRLSSQIFALRQLSPVLPKQALREVYFGIIHSHICYGILLWGGSTKSNRVFILQKRAVRVLDGIQQDVSCRESFNKFNILPLPCIFILESLVSTHRNCNNLLRHSDIHKYNTRTAGNLVWTYSRLDITSKNKVDLNLYNMFVKKFEHTNCRNMSIASFKILVKSYLLEQCFYSVDEFKLTLK
nr:unnamed protein product [Callosobruchus chinensis]